MKNLFKFSSLLIAAVLLLQISCDEDDPAPVDNTPDPTGKWKLQMATLVSPDPLVVDGYTTDGQNFITLEVPAGDVTTTSTLVGGALAGTVCEDPTTYGTFYLELTADNKLIFYCPDGVPPVVDPDKGTWVILETDGVYSVTLNVQVGGSTLPITVDEFELAEDGSTMSGRANGYPMVKDLRYDIGVPIDGDATNPNIQFMATDLIFDSVE